MNDAKFYSAQATWKGSVNIDFSINRTRLKPVFQLATLFAQREKSRNASYLFAAIFFADQF